MADVKISGMTAASALTGAEVLPVVQSAANVKATTQQVVDAAMTTGLTRQALGSINTNTTIDWSAGSYVTATIGGALTFTFSNPAPTGKACVAYLQLTNGGSAVITWPVSVTWSGGTAPTLSASGVDLLRFYTQDNGTTWFGTAENDEALPAATTTTSGVVELATVAECQAGTDTTRATTPEGVAAAIAALAPGGSPGGSTTEVQFNNAGVFDGMSGTAWDDTNRCLTITGATVTTSKPILDLTQTWNAGAVAFKGISFQVTNTASSANSRYLDIGVGADTYRFALLRNTTSTYDIGISGGSGLTTGFRVAQYQITIMSNGSLGFKFDNNGAFHTGRLGLGASSGGDGNSFLYSDAANTPAFRNTTNAQTFRVYRSYTDASNYSRWTVKWNTSTAILHAEGAGTGSDGSVAFNDAALATDATVGFLMIPSCAGTPTGTPADIPTGQAPIVYNSTDKKLCVWDGAAWVQTAALT